jgi:tetratricopeptide (TPR) repeat protein
LYQFERNPNAIEHDKVLSVFQEAINKYPDFGPGWAALANLTLNNYVLGYSNEGAQLLSKGLIYARKAVEKNPNHQLVRTMYGYSCLIDNKLEDCINQLEYARSLNPKSAFFIGSIGFISCLAGNWKQGMENLTTSFQLNPDYPSWYHISTTLYYLKEKDFKKALVESLKIDLPLIFWDNVLKSVCYVYNDNPTKAEMYLIQINEFMPDFFNKPIYYLKKLIKFDDILETVVEGLVKAGFEEEILLGNS